MVKLYSIYTNKGSNLSNQRTSWFTNLLSIFSENKNKTLYEVKSFKPKIHSGATTASKANILRKQK